MNQFLLPTENATAHAWAIEVGQYYILKGAAGREQAKSILLGMMSSLGSADPQSYVVDAKKSSVTATNTC
jgi:hypothetical protein